MKVTFGMALDGMELRKESNSLGEVVCGPRRLIDILETRLGLKQKPISAVARILQLVKFLEEDAKNNKRFYSASFERDPLAVAETLLQWRDSLLLYGWNGLSDGVSARLADLADIHGLLVRDGFLSLSDRLIAVHNILEHRNHGLEIVVVESSSSLPLLWRKTLIKLSAKFSPVEEAFSAQPETGETDLSRLRTAIRLGETKKIKLRNDGSVLLLSAYSEFILAHRAAEIFREICNDSHTLVASPDCTALDEILITSDHSALGVQPASLARPIPQLLMMALRLCWKPLNPLHLLEFLIHPHSPIEFHLGKELSRALIKCPGVGGPNWLAAIESARQIYKLKFPEEANALSARLEKDLSNWINISRYDHRDGAAGTELAACCSRMAKWAKGCVVKEEEQGDRAKASLFHALASEAFELGEALMGIDKVPQCRLERLIRKVSGDGWSAPRVSELGHGHRIGKAAACIEPADVVLWWNFSEPQLPVLPHWTRSEIEELKIHGAEIPSAAAILSTENANELRPVWAARKKLLLFTPRQRNGEPVVIHPIFSRLQAVVDGKFPTTDVDIDVRKGRIPRVQKHHHTPLKGSRRWWKLRVGKSLEGRQTESFSSAEKFIYSPYAWVLDYKAALRPGVLSQFRMQNDSILRGNLLHRLLELLVAGPLKGSAWGTITESELKKHIDERWPVLLEQEGATFLLLGKQSEAIALVATAKRALWSLVQQLRVAKIREATANVNFNAEFVGGKLDGYVDLLVKNEALDSAVIDLKFGRLEEKTRELQTNTQLQLAIYGFMHQRARNEWPASAYFILNTGRMLAQDKNYFPDASLTSSKGDSTGLEVCWNEIIEMWKYRRSLLDQGWIELTVSGTEPQNGDSFPRAVPLEHWMPRKDEDKYNDFKALTGVEVNA
ncbi:MAG: hypothetical protein JWM68_4554 [Verrucomicrobiales bacterium]|nr:hypothetical protein [Verrucomicrobiales bacterium]